MRKISILLVAVLTVFSIQAQKDVASKTAGTIAPTTEEGEKSWKFGGGIGIFANQVALVNWSAGGVSSISGLANGNIFANFRKGKHSWETSLTAEYGMIKQKNADLKKNADIWELKSKYGYQIDKNGKVFVGALLNFTSQFTEGYKDGETRYSSNFLAPGNMILAAGIDWKPNKTFSLFFSPAAGKLTFVLDKGVDETAYGLEAGATTRMEFGAYLKAQFQKELMKNVNFKTTLSLYNNYLDASQDDVYDENGVLDATKGFNRGNIDVDWITGLDLVVNKWITVNISTQLIYDHNVKINLVDAQNNDAPLLNADGVQKVGPRTQFKEALNVGFTYKFAPKEKK